MSTFICQSGAKRSGYVVAETMLEAARASGFACPCTVYDVSARPALTETGDEREASSLTSEELNSCAMLEFQTLDQDGATELSAKPKRAKRG